MIAFLTVPLWTFVVPYSTPIALIGGAVHIVIAIAIAGRYTSE